MLERPYFAFGCWDEFVELVVADLDAQASISLPKQAGMNSLLGGEQMSGLSMSLQYG